MKIAWTRMKGVCLLLLGLATTGGGRSFAADINTQNFSTLAESSSVTSGGTTTVSPFKDESAGTSAKSVVVESALPNYSESCPAGCSPSCAAGFACDNDNFCGAPGRFWFRGEYLHWWTSGAHLPPMVSTLTGANGTVPETIFGNQEIGDGDHDGYRTAMGMWLDCQHHWGLEADYFDVTGKSNNYDSGSTEGFDANGRPSPIVRLVYDPATFAATGLASDYVGFANFYVGRITVQTSDYFQSAGIWLRRQLRACEWSTCGNDVNWTDPSARTFRLDAIAGYRFARLIDTVNEQDDSFEYNPLQAAYYLKGFTFINDYKTVNCFNGADLGLNAVYTHGRWSVDVVGKAAIGGNNQYLRLYNQEFIDTNNIRPGTPPAPQNPTALQEISRNQFSAIPELTVTGGYQVTDHFKVTVGYDLLYWSAVVRAADQINVEPTTGYPYGTVTGNYAALPAFAWNESHFFAQGLRLGADLRF